MATDAGFEVEHIYNGQEALQRLDQDPIPSLVLLDTRLPGADGDEIMLAARSKEKWAAVPIFMITADLSAAKRYRDFAPDVPHANGVIEKGTNSMSRLRELFEKYQENGAG